MPEDINRDSTAPQDCAAGQTPDDGQIGPEEIPDVTGTDEVPEGQSSETEENPAEAEECDDETEESAAQTGEAEEPDQLTVLKDELEKAIAQRDEYLAMAQRAQADYQNFKRRNNATRTEAYDEGVRETIAALLPAVDNLERAVAAAEAEEGALKSGVEMTLRQMMTSLTKLGLEEVPALGEKFDPDIHNAVMRAQDGEGEPGTVLEVFQKGYRVKGRMIRYAMVKIAAEN